VSGQAGPVPGFTSPDDCARAREALDRGRYDTASIGERLDSANLVASRAIDVPPWLRATREGTPRDVLIRLFLIGVPVPAAAAREALAPLPLENWARAGLVRIDGDDVTPQLRLLPFRDLRLASDLPRSAEARACLDFVMGVGKGTRILADVRVQTPSRRSLDVGTGCGPLAFALARHSEHVIATDVTERAVSMTRLNAALNGFDNVEVRLGDRFAPVEGERFDRITSHPPYVIAPSTRYRYRDSGVRGDEFCRDVARGSATHLEEGGFLHMAFNCAHITGRVWQDDLRSWFEDLGCDALVWPDETESASEYATTWIRDTESSDPEEMGDLYEEWMRFFDAQRIEAVTYGILNLRRSGRTRHWIEIDESSFEVRSACGDTVARTFEAIDFVADASDEAMLRHRFRIAPEIQIEQVARSGEAGLTVQHTVLRRVEGITRDAHLDPYGGTLALGCDGTRALGVILDELAGSLGGDTTSLRAGGVEVARRLARRGFLIPA
jgi:2-polyprenyl-3-methyl-5-hydroxy-6-metoxy-1,4-benzoquinol methylase